MLFGALFWASPAAANTISVDDVQVTESTGATVGATFTLTRAAGLLSGPVTVGYRTEDGTATSPADYVATSGNVSFGLALLGGMQRQQVTVQVQGDALDEANETFRLVISGNEVVPGGGTATIDDDDDSMPTVSVANSAPVSEGTAGAHATFLVSLSAASGRDVSVGFTTANGSAGAGSDYATRSGTLVLSAGSTQAAVDVGILDDNVVEATETFELRLSSALGATIGDGIATGTILDDDQPGSGSGPSAPGAQPRPTIPLPVIGSTGPTAGSSTPSLGVSSPRLKRPSTALVTISCPKVAGRCSGRITLFSIPNKRSKIKALRKERKLGRLSFVLEGGRSKTLALKLGRTDRRLLQRTGRMRVRAYALTQDAAGRSGVRSVSGTLIARLAHSSPRR
jgi:hypothetical protein